MGNALQFRPKTSKFQSCKCRACHYAFARGVHAPCDGLLTLRQNNSYYRLFPHSSFTQLESLMIATSSYATETLFNILQTPSYAKLFKFHICNCQNLLHEKGRFDAIVQLFILGVFTWIIWEALRTVASQKAGRCRLFLANCATNYHYHHHRHHHYHRFGSIGYPPSICNWNVG